MDLINKNGSQTSGFPSTIKDVVLNGTINESETVVLYNDVEGTITGTDFQDNVITVSTFLLKVCGGFKMKTISAVTGILITDLKIVE